MVLETTNVHSPQAKASHRGELRIRAYYLSERRTNCWGDSASGLVPRLFWREKQQTVQRNVRHQQATTNIASAATQHDDCSTIQAITLLAAVGVSVSNLLAACSATCSLWWWWTPAAAVMYLHLSIVLRNETTSTSTSRNNKDQCQLPAREKYHHHGASLQWITAQSGIRMVPRLPHSLPTLAKTRGSQNGAPQHGSVLS